MPTYEYQCRTCGHRFERVQKFSDAPLTECPQCSGEVRRVIHSAGIVFKGSGWYITDSRKGSESKSESKSEAKAETKAESKDGGTSSASGGESKPAEKAAAKD